MILWLRCDLRLDDNPALAAAAASGSPVIPLYILDETPGVRPLGGASRWWLGKSLQALGDDLARLGSPLVLRRGRSAAVLDRVIAETGARAVLWNRLYDAPSTARDAAIKAELKARGLECKSFNAALLNEPWTIRTGSGAGYQLFTPYWRAARSALNAIALSPRPTALTPPGAPTTSDALSDWGLHPNQPDWSGGFALWTPGEAGAVDRLGRFLDNALSSYPTARDRPALAGVSRLSPHLHFGEISPRRIWLETQSAAAEHGLESQADKFLSEIGWREFNHHVLHHNPDLGEINLRPAFDRFPWRDDRAGFAAWTEGRTGYPLVDAGMRELWATGWMHNRVRMVAASFLVKHLMIDWRQGEAWFWDTLVDADPAQNAGNWQWVAGSGADAAPYFRIFNPVIQGEKFDAAGDYIRRWVPELSGLSAKTIHRPWTVPSAGQAYPRPIIDHAQARTRALAAFAELKSPT